MSNRKSKPTEYRWKIIHLRSTPAADLGTATAPDERTTTERAAAVHNVPAHLRYRLLARQLN
jgi:hypothetical protein